MSTSDARDRSRSPSKKEWDLKYESRADDSKLDRHRDARRSMKPAWMTKGVGCGQDMFGTPTGIIKPGDDLLKDIKPRDPNEPDPMGDVYRSVVKTVDVATPAPSVKVVAEKEPEKPTETKATEKTVSEDDASTVPPTPVASPEQSSD